MGQITTTRNLVAIKVVRHAGQSPASRLFTQSFIQVQIKENIKAPRHWTLCGEFTGDGLIPRTSNAENVSSWWRHHVNYWFLWGESLRTPLKSRFGGALVMFLLSACCANGRVFCDLRRLYAHVRHFNEFCLYRVEREVTRDVNIKGIFMPKDSLIGINITGCHMNPDVWPEPEVFNPDRYVVSYTANFIHPILNLH